jgi:hypothetical protein
MAIKKMMEATSTLTTKEKTEHQLKKQEIKKEKVQESENLGAEKHPPE